MDKETKTFVETTIKKHLGKIPKSRSEWEWLCSVESSKTGSVLFDIANALNIGGE